MNKMLTTFLKQPLLHFLLLGALIFVAYRFTAEPVEEESGVVAADLIEVNRNTLLDFMQYRASAFEPDVFNARLAAMSQAEVDALVKDYVREEALYREALKMGMEEGDYIIRQRLVQKVEFLLENLVMENISPSGQELQEFYATHLDDYRMDAVYSFTHIFFDAQQGGMEQARARAEATLANSGSISFEQAAEYGDRYPFLQDYEERTRDFIVNNFSAEFVDALDTLVPEEQKWQGPLESRYGYHLVLLRSRSEPYTPSLQEISEQVLDDYRYEALLLSRQEAEDKVVEEYEVAVNLE